VALARDAGIFRELGYTVDSLRGIDLFPSSHHVEAVAVLTR
jgi:tRNA/tmRNA/rRNA uracil-C5-methylase (TrmA/RlmC/RlmD family)